MKLTDGKKTVEIEIRGWNGSGYGPDWSADYFCAGNLPLDEETGAHVVDDVDYCIDMANSTGRDGARVKFDEDGECIPNEDVIVTVTELPTKELEYKAIVDKDGDLFDIATSDDLTTAIDDAYNYIAHLTRNEIQRITSHGGSVWVEGREPDSDGDPELYIRVYP